MRSPGLSQKEQAVLTERRRPRRHQHARELSSSSGKRRATVGAAIGVAVIVVVMGAAIVALGPRSPGQADHPSESSHRADSSKKIGLPVAPESYLGLYAPGAPASYSGTTSFTAATGIRPNLAVYYSGWFEPFWTSFAVVAAQHGAVPLVQLNPRGASVAAIAAGQYDTYLRTYAEAVRGYGHPVILSFGHEMNGQWYPWGFRHTSPTLFVAAWRHRVNVFRKVGARNVTWMWTINTIELKRDMIPDPNAWWPGSSYVNWGGIDGYFHKRSAQFAVVFGPTIVDVRELTQDPILISETGAAPDAGLPAKIASLFAGVRAYKLLGFVWFDAIGNADYRIDSPAAIAAIRHGARTYPRPSV